MENQIQGYKNLSFFKQTEIIYDFTAEFCNRYIEKTSRTKDQMVQAARSGKQNIAEGYLEKSLKGKIKLLGVARASLEELLQDYQDFLRQRNLSVWNINSPESRACRALVYKTYKHYNDYKNYINSPENAANAMLCLINQTNMLLDKKIRNFEKEFVEKGGYTENLFKKRVEYRKRFYI